MKKRIALVTGGYSGEAAVSYQSARMISENIDQEKFDFYTIDITRDGWSCLENDTKVPVDKSDFSIIVKNQKIYFDAVLMCIHGSPGEDGKLQGYFDMLNIPYTSCNAAVSAITFNKRYTVSVAAFSGVKVAHSVLLIKNKIENLDAVKNLIFPVFVKPNNGGSSIGMSKVASPDEVEAAIEKAFQEDNQVLVEEFIEGRELTIGVFSKKGEIVCLPITEIISKNTFFDFEAKYLGKSDEITPANVDALVAEKVRETAKKIYKLFNCKGVVRIDFIYNEKLKEPFMLEINTVPGQSAASLIPQQVRAMGINLKEFYTTIIEESFV